MVITMKFGGHIVAIYYRYHHIEQDLCNDFRDWIYYIQIFLVPYRNGYKGIMYSMSRTFLTRINSVQ